VNFVIRPIGFDGALLEIAPLRLCRPETPHVELPEVHPRIAINDPVRHRLAGAKQGLVLRTLRVVDVPRSRVGAKLVANFCTDLTPKEEREKVRERSVQQILAREKGSGRPTKRDRRLLDDLLQNG
jgi:ribosome-associated heat shock protein Hsp15